VTMYRCFKRPADLFEQHQLDKRKLSSHENTRMAAHRQQELEDIGRGGSSEVPCMRCPVFDICGDGGPVNVVTCKYFDEWYVKLAEADMETGIEQHGSKEKPNAKHKPAGKPEDNSLTNGGTGPTVEVALEPS